MTQNVDDDDYRDDNALPHRRNGPASSLVGSLRDGSERFLAPIESAALGYDLFGVMDVRTMNG
ncbi:MAG: hypothetical protein AAFP00_17930, partial [Bacteroidota bacterium]